MASKTYGCQLRALRRGDWLQAGARGTIPAAASRDVLHSANHAVCERVDSRSVRGLHEGGWSTRIWLWRALNWSS